MAYARDANGHLVCLGMGELDEQQRTFRLVGIVSKETLAVPWLIKIFLKQRPGYKILTRRPNGARREFTYEYLEKLEQRFRGVYHGRKS